MLIHFCVPNVLRFFGQLVSQASRDVMSLGVLTISHSVDARLHPAMYATHACALGITMIMIKRAPRHFLRDVGGEKTTRVSILTTADKLSLSLRFVATVLPCAALNAAYLALVDQGNQILIHANEESRPSPVLLLGASIVRSTTFRVAMSAKKKVRQSRRKIHRILPTNILQALISLLMILSKVPKWRASSDCFFMAVTLFFCGRLSI